MDKKILENLLAVFPTFLSLAILAKFFPATGLGRILAIPMIIGINIIINIVGLKVAHHMNGAYKSIIWITIGLVTFMIPFFIWPQESNPAVVKQLKYSFLAIKNYDRASKKDLDLPLAHGYNYDPWNHVKNIDGAPERYIVALYKYRHQIPLDGSYHVYRENETHAENHPYDTSIKRLDEIPAKLDPQHRLIWKTLEMLRK